MLKKLPEREERIEVQVFPNGINRVHIPILNEEESAKRQKRLYDAAVELLKAQERHEMEKKGETTA